MKKMQHIHHPRLHLDHHLHHGQGPSSVLPDIPPVANTDVHRRASIYVCIQCISSDVRVCMCACDWLSSCQLPHLMLWGETMLLFKALCSLAEGLSALQHSDTAACNKSPLDPCKSHAERARVCARTLQQLVCHSKGARPGGGGEK